MAKLFLRVTWPALALMLPEVWQDGFTWLRAKEFWPWLQAGVWLWLVLALTLSVPWRKVYNRRASGATTTLEPKPNWQYYEAMNYIADRLGLASEQDIDGKSINTARLLTQEALAGNIRVWGKRITRDGPELLIREIPAKEWQNKEPLICACMPYSTQPQTRSISIDNLPGAYEFTDLHVNETEIKAINWQSEKT